MEKLSAWLYRISTGWIAFLGLMIFLVFIAFVLPRQSSLAQAVSDEAGSPDTSFFYTPQELYDMAEVYGDQGRKAYIQARFSFDLIWPVAYTFFLCTAISWVFERAFPHESRWRWANLAPVLGMFLDYLENISTSLVMYLFPTPVPLIAWSAPFFTTAKWILVFGSFGLLLLGIVKIIWQKVIKNR